MNGDEFWEKVVDLVMAFLIVCLLAWIGFAGWHLIHNLIVCDSVWSTGGNCE